MSVNTFTDPAGAAEFKDAQKAVRTSRRAFAQSESSAFVRVMQRAMELYLEARAQGVSREDACRGLEVELRDAWPKSVSKFKPACDACEDTGFVGMVCWDQHRCGREQCVNNPERQHDYVEMCHCPAGDRKRKRVHTQEDEIAAVAKVKKPKRGFSRFGQ